MLNQPARPHSSHDMQAMANSILRQYADSQQAAARIADTKALAHDAVREYRDPMAEKARRLNEWIARHGTPADIIACRAAMVYVDGQ